ncbi:MAG: MSMEG_4193 family putative phosphomutase [Streptosporangiales bacterium]|nr:MSMEG_4193 family putative phosphomutase [Streptosporangiales bacterium]
MAGVTTVLLVRHGRTAANTAGVLAGWTPGVHLDDTGSRQAATLAERLAPVPLAGIVSSPLERCRETAQAIRAGRDGVRVRTDKRLGEVRYGQWEGQDLKHLSKDPLWRTVQAHPSAVRFPDGEAMRDMQTRAVDAIREWNASHGADATYLVCSHGDVIKAIVADALGMHLDLFQRIQVDPCSLTVIRYTELRPFVVRQNDRGGDVADLVPPPPRKRRRKASSDAVVGGGAG